MLVASPNVTSPAMAGLTVTYFVSASPSVERPSTVGLTDMCHPAPRPGPARPGSHPGPRPGVGVGPRACRGPRVDGGPRAVRHNDPPMVPEAPLTPADGGLAPSGEGWFVVNAAEARWLDGAFGAYTRFEGEPRFTQVGVNIGVLAPGQAACLYHREDAQEDFLVLSGECLLLVEGQERRLRAWDFVHCPPGTDHVFVGAGDGPCAILAVGARTTPGDTVYPVSELAQRHGAGAPREIVEPDEAYAEYPTDRPARFRPDWLPGASPG